jgi:hypothetical protein
MTPHDHSSADTGLASGGALDKRSAEADEEQRVNEIVERGPAGTFMVAGIATVIVVSIYFAFYFFAYLPRGIVH